jgi:hypothetical protein
MEPYELIASVLKFLQEDMPLKSQTCYDASEESVYRVLTLIQSAAGSIDNILREQCAFASITSHSQSAQGIMKIWTALWNNFRSEETSKFVIEALEGLADFVTTYERVLVVLDSGHFAFVHKSCEVGDVIALIAGLNVPMLLRPVGNKYRIVGRAFVYGAMDGELWPRDQGALQTMEIL